ncbi:acyltransferase [Sabulilitoribacter multivorans]|uniref:Acyltransferase n=1 Tax=Flaviramulus multivorans TaxID=1304750 RepID=A0ABS9IH35_9FLAO|nr:acyltransferase [Flaviramulus multivorans]MCF7560039.1 acyltransferase [Flaviramulus multivorans]
MRILTQNIYNLFKRETSQKYIPELDGLRFLAILWVVLLHIQVLYQIQINPTISDHGFEKLLWYIINNGHMGVPLFFAISGFILGLPFAKHHLVGVKKVSLRKYFWKRITRLEPPYIIALSSIFLIKVVLNKSVFLELLPNLGASLLYLHNFIYHSASKITPIAWSLEIEIQFYVVAPIIALIYRLGLKRRRFIFLLAIFIIPFLRNFIDISFFSFFRYVHYFLVGMLLCDLYVTKSQISINKGLALVLGLILLFSLLLSDSYGFWAKVIYPFLIFMFYYIVLNTQFWQNVFRIKWISIIGGMCYSIYLLHYVLISVIIKRTSLFSFSTDYTINILVQILILLPIILIVCSIYYLLIEKPCMNINWPKNFKKYILKHIYILLRPNKVK